MTFKNDIVNYTCLQIKSISLNTCQNKLRFSSLFRTFLFAGLFLSLCVSQLLAKPTTDSDARTLVTGWLNAEAQPLGISLGQQISDVETFSDANEQPIYYVAYLNPSGFVIISADDQVEPIIAFSQNGRYDPSPDNPLGTLVSQDVPNRIGVIRKHIKDTKNKSYNHLSTEELKIQKTVTKAQGKWDRLRGRKANAKNIDKFSISEMAALFSSTTMSDISDVRVEPLLQSKWNQGSVYGDYCYNYYIPNHYPCGCTATATAQLMRYHEYPTEAVGVQEFYIDVDGRTKLAYTRGGDGNGGPYNWAQMVYDPDSNTTDEQRQAIGTLCYDVGVTVWMEYSSGGSGASLGGAHGSLLTFFGYDNSVHQDVGLWTYDMLNTNLDAGYPMLFDIRGSIGGHAVVCDGYGFDSSTIYHHINMGWSGSFDTWYNLPEIGSYNSILVVVYNVFPSGTGEIISGRVADALGNSISNVNIIAEYGVEQLYTTTNNKGIYSFPQILSNTTFVISASKENLDFSNPIEIHTGRSVSSHGTGNIWGANFEEITRPLIQVNEGSLEFQVPAGQFADSQILQISNAGYSTLNWQIIYDCNWLVVSPTQGISTGEISEVTLIADTNNLQPGRYSCELIISDPCALNNPQSVLIDLFVGGTIYVPTDYPTIQEAIDVSGPGSEIIILPGTYTGQGNRDIDFRGKAITVRSTNPANSDVVADTIIDCNSTEVEQHNGFKFHSYEDSNSVLSGITIKNSSGKWGLGGGIVCSLASPLVINCIITENNSSGIYCSNIVPGGYYDTPMTVTNCIITNNNDTGCGFRGGNYVVTDCLISNNNGSGILIDGGHVSVKNCLVVSNTCDYGSGIYNSTRSPGELSVENCTIANNVFYTEGGGILSGHGIWADETVRISDSILWDNAPEQIVIENNSVNVSYSDIEGGWHGIGNINIDPCFVDPCNSDYHLKSNGWRWTPYQYGSCDFNGDEIVNLVDFAEFAKSWLQSGQYLLADINKDEIVDLDDLYLFVQQYLTSSNETGEWTWDDVTSRCIDAGNPSNGLCDEPMTLYVDPLNRRGENLRINMGAYGGTAQASMAPTGWVLLPDVTNDGTVNLCDFAHFASDWLDTSEAKSADFNRNGTINLDDLIFLVNDWLGTTIWY